MGNGKKRAKLGSFFLWDGVKMIQKKFVTFDAVGKKNLSVDPLCKKRKIWLGEGVCVVYLVMEKTELFCGI